MEICYNMKVFDSIINSYRIKKINKMLFKMVEYQNTVSKFTDQEIYDEFQKYKKSNSKKYVIKGLPFLFALIREVFSRTLNIIPYDEQYICAASLYMGYITEMKTGEGKTIAAAIAAIFCSLYGKVHIVTVNDYLANRDYQQMKGVFEKFGISCGVNEGDSRNKKKSQNNDLYNNDVVYSSSTELIFDYLRNQLLPEETQIEFPLDSVIIDEIDFVLLDNANSVFAISTGFGYVPFIGEYMLAKEICTYLKGERRTNNLLWQTSQNSDDVHYIYYTDNKIVDLTENGLEFIEKIIKDNNLVLNNLKLYKAIILTLEANLFFNNGYEYIVQDGKIVVINKTNGRLKYNSHFGNDMHTALEIKENLKVTKKTLLSDSLSYQVFFMKYKHMVGMSGTVYDAREEFEKLYKMPSVFVPTHKPNKRIDWPDIFFNTKKDKYDYLVFYTKNSKRKGQPILIFTGSEEESTVLYDIFKQNDIECNLLNAQNTTEEPELIKKAGIHDAITISTNLAGRGTDIVLDDEAKNAGGLLVIILNRYSSKRIDNQARGRTARQGEPGECVCLISFEDELWQHSNPTQLEKIKDIAGNDFFVSSPSQSKKLSKILNKIQIEIQLQYFRQRQTIMTQSEIIESQRLKIIKWKNEIKNINPIKVLVSYVENFKINNSMLKIWDEENNTIDVDIDNIEKAVEDKYIYLGESIALDLFNQLVEKIVKQEWLFYKNEIEAIRDYLRLGTLNQNEIIKRYIKICDDEFENLKNNILKELLGYFLTAELKQFSDTEAAAVGE